MRHVFETYAIENCGFCREWFCAQAYVKVGVSALHNGNEYNSSGAVRTDQSTTAAQQYGSTHHSGTPVVRQELGGLCTYLQLSTFRGKARAVTHQAPTTHHPPTKHPPPTTHPPTNPPPQQYNTSGAVRTDQSTTAAQQCDSTHNSGTPVVRLELGGICTSVRLSTFRGRARAVTQAPTTHPPTNPPTDQPTTAVQQQWSSTYRPIHNGSTAVRQYAPQRYTCGTPGAGWNLHLVMILHLPGESASRHPPTDQSTTTAVQQQRSSTY